LIPGASASLEQQVNAAEVVRFFANLPNVLIESFDRKDLRSFLKSDKVLFLKEHQHLFEEMVAKHGTD